MTKNRKKELERFKANELTPDEQLKYEIAQELGLLEKVETMGWKSLSARETGRIGGLVARRKKEKSRT